MAYDNRYSNNRGYGQQGGYNRGYGQNNGGPQRYQNTQSAEITPLKLPENYVDAAEQVMRALYENRSRITTTKMRGFLTLVNDIYNAENLRTETELSSESKLKLMRLRVRVVYDAGRERDVKDFVEKAKLLEYLKGVGDSREAMIHFAHYMEALVAYHRYLGGRDN
ncbi:MAG: type III-A CRISPR-associated protein Csm2 [Clostridia bacterium]|nr:type III-A CRISPR-associated protein Csm2 [Clostridia bacterium]